MNEKPSKFWAVAAVITGGVLFISAALNIPGLVVLDKGNPIQAVLQDELGAAAANYLGFILGPLALLFGLDALLGKRSKPVRLPPFFIFMILFALVLGLGSVLLNFNAASDFLFPLTFVLGAAMPSLAVLAWVYRRLGWPLTIRQAVLAFIAGSSISIAVAIFLEITLPWIAIMLIWPLFLRAEAISTLGWGQPGFVEKLMASPLILVFLIITAIEAPIPEEFAKALGVPMFGRMRIQNERQAFAIGLACGAGFAVLENMLYEGIYAQAYGWGWAGVTLLRGIGSILHPLCSGLVALGWFRMKEQGGGKLFRAYLAAVGLHTLWNGGFEPLVYLTGLDTKSAARTVSLYGEPVSFLLVVYLVALSAGLWWLLRRIAASLGEGIEIDLSFTVQTRRAMAGWALACAVVIILIGAAVGRALAGS